MVAVTCGFLVPIYLVVPLCFSTVSLLNFILHTASFNSGVVLTPFLSFFLYIFSCGVVACPVLQHPQHPHPFSLLVSFPRTSSQAAPSPLFPRVLNLPFSPTALSVTFAFSLILRRSLRLHLRSDPFLFLAFSAVADFCTRLSHFFSCLVFLTSLYLASFRAFPS